MSEPTMYDLGTALARVEAKQDAILDVLKEHIEDDKEVHADHEKRVRSIERARWTMHGAVVSVAAVVSSAIAYAAEAMRGN